MKNQKNYILAGIATMLFALPALAQQAPVFSSYYFNRFIINPAFTGIDNQYRAFGFYRSQWADMPGRPVTGGATLESSFWKDRIGAGIYFLNDRIGIFERNNISFSYAQKIRFARDHQVTIGVMGGAFLNRINFSSSRYRDGADPYLADQNLQKAVFDMSVGVSYKWKELLFGFAVPQVIQPNAKYADSSGQATNYQYVRHYNAYAQYRIKLAKGKFNITPTLFMRKGAATGFQFDANLLFDYKNMVFVGAGYRNSFGVVVMGGVNVLDMFTIAYAYDATTQRTLSGQVGGTHEVTAGFHLPSNFKPKKKNPKDLDIKSESDEMQAIRDLQKTNDSLKASVRRMRVRLDSTTTLLKAKQSAAAEKESSVLQKRIDSLQKQIQQKETLGSFNKAATADSAHEAYKLDKIYFNPNKAELLPESRDQLDALVAALKRTPTMEITINGYADNSGSAEYNQNLSEQRAKAVADYLVSQGIKAGRISHKGYGSQNPIADNNTEEGRKMNRRVEFTITKQ